MSGNNTRARGHSPIRSYRANEKTGRAERHTREACLVRRESVRVRAVPGGYPGVPYGAPLRFLLS